MVMAVGGDRVVMLPKPALRDPDFKLGLTQYSANERTAALTVGTSYHNDLCALDNKPQQVWKAAQHNTPNRTIDFLVAEGFTFKLYQRLPKGIVEGRTKP